ncbi:MAG: Gfo/Idh/MocA family oxidoreductase [Elusimicrobia bacterium]|nr:Gfo/Idh/MocA family oxidoreductase [Elusimicrobiota bacterium]
MPINVAVIGKRNQAARHIEFIKKQRDARLAAVYCPGKAEAAGLPLTDDFDDVLRADAVIVASPTPTHAHYLSRLKAYRGYILLEKPAVSFKEEEKIFLDWSDDLKSRTRVNFNLLFSKLTASMTEAIASGRLGRLAAFDVHASHGLAFKPGYPDSWRSRAETSLGVMENVGVHYTHLALALFGGIAQSRTDMMWLAKRQGPPDTGVFHLTMDNDLRVRIRLSYAAPYCSRWFLLGTDGFWEYDGKEARLCAPRETLDKKGRFGAPPIVKRVKLDYALAWMESLQMAQKEFFSVAASRGRFDREEFKLSLRAMDPVFQAKRDLQVSGGPRS